MHVLEMLTIDGVAVSRVYFFPYLSIFLLYLLSVLFYLL